ncbi:MAG: S49 family peptidase [Pirellulaceae bacterium]
MRRPRSLSTRFLDDLTASAAYWVASQATKVYANNKTALIGSIGTFAVLIDQSKRAEQLGVKVHVIKAGDFKGTGTPGTAITDKQLAHMQHIVDAANAEFLRGVATGRKMGSLAISAVADGRVHVAAEAKRLGLIDDVKPFDDVVRDLER